ncbi:MAG: sugar transferase [Oscillospiraceae bacterium]|jgi:lipopolysaccharide/colanic/teichoic acid biosynthesis glycosyltransferase|nr:sugar transferase [Oscillospiraceae bacterium]
MILKQPINKSVVLEQSTSNIPLPEYTVIKNSGYRYIYNFIKRFFDIVLSVLALVVLAVPMLIVVLFIKAEDGGKAIYKSERIGKNGRPFNMYKFRTMEKGNKQLQEVLTKEELEEYSKEFKLKNDPRLTKVGKLLRKTSMDELPQLFNILKSDMSIVGPRPVLDEETQLYGDYRDYLLSAKPGMTGYWQAYARNNVGYSNGKRQQMELHYVTNRSLWFDIKIIFATVARVFSGKGAF